MKYIDNSIVFNSVKEIGKNAGLNANYRYAGSQYNFDDNDNPAAPKFLMNAIDIDWNGAQLSLPGELKLGTTLTINTTGPLLNTIRFAYNHNN